MATDESYRDPTNLQSKLQKHQAFEAELSSNKDRVDSVCQVLQLATESPVPNLYLHVCKTDLGIYSESLLF